MSSFGGITKDTQMTPTATYSHVLFQQDAIDIVDGLFERQIHEAVSKSAKINSAVTGDTEARNAFWMLLNVDFQRMFFLRRCKSRSFWPRIRTLIGSPPFSFLHPEDNFVLNPSGITTTRKNMAHKERCPIHSSTEIGGGHFFDDNGRVYKIIVVETNTKHTDASSVVSVYNTLVQGRKVVADLKLPKTTKHLNAFPKCREIITLKINDNLASPSNRQCVVRVNGIVQRQYRSGTCRVFCVVQ